MTGDGIPDLVIGAGPGGSPVVVVDGSTRQTVNTFTPFGTGFTGGTFVAAGDVNGDGRADVAVSADTTGGPRVVVFDGRTGLSCQLLRDRRPGFRGGARVALGDLNGDGVADLAVAAGPGGGPRVALYDGATIRAGAVPTRLTNDFFVFDQALRDGAYVSIGDVNGDGFGDLIAGAGSGGGPRGARPLRAGPADERGGRRGRRPGCQFLRRPGGNGRGPGGGEGPGRGPVRGRGRGGAGHGRPKVLAFRGADLITPGQPPVFRDYSDTFDPLLNGVFVG